jgi:O-antigen ligase
MLYVYKSMRNRLDSWRSSILFWLIAIMMIALFFSRALLSAGMMGFIAASFFHTGIRQQFRQFFSSPLLWGMSLLFIVPLISGLWSEDKQEWADILRIKLPLLFLPLAFAAYAVSWSFSAKQWDWLGLLFIALITGGTCWSLFHYAGDAAAINESYLRAKAIVTPLENDRVRFSWLVSVAVLLSGWLAVEKRKENKVISVSLAIVAILLIVFLHLLAVRTGLISLYIMMMGVALWLAFKKLKKVYAVGLILVLFALPFVAYKTIPSFQNRVKYIRYDFDYFIAGNYFPSSNDATRVASLKAGWKVMNSAPFSGVGAGDVFVQTKKYYEIEYSSMIEPDKIYPSSEWLIYGAAAGWPGLLVFSLALTIPFFTRTKNKLIWWLLNATAAFSFIFDIGLEVQFGVFIYAFVILSGYQWLNAKKM